jgi:hypothetical protein
MTLLRLLTQIAALAVARACWMAGSSIEARMAITATTTSSSISVNRARRLGLDSVGHGRHLNWGGRWQSRRLEDFNQVPLPTEIKYITVI